MKKALVFLVVGLLAIPATAIAIMEMGLGTTFNVYNESRAKGQGRTISIIFDINDDFRAGYITERIDNLTLKSAGISYPGAISVDSMMFLLKVAKVAKVNCNLGINVGNADIIAPPVGAFVGLVESVPVLDLLARFEYTPMADKKVVGTIAVGVGYRFMDVTDVAVPFGAGTKTLDDLSGLIINFSAGLKF